MAQNEEALRALAARLARRDAAMSANALAAAEGGLGPAPAAIEPAPRGTYPIAEGGVAGEPATLAVPSRSSYDMMSTEERHNSFGDAATRGALASMVAGGAAAAGIGWLGGPAVAEASAFPGIIGGGAAGAALQAPYGMVGAASDMAAGEAFRTPATAGTFTAGPRMAAELEGRYLPEQPWTQRRGIEGQAISPASVEAAAERVEQRRLEQRAQEQILITQRQREMEEHQRRLAEARAKEAARQGALTRQFGSPTGRAEDILALEALRMAE